VSVPDGAQRHPSGTNAVVLLLLLCLLLLSMKSGIRRHVALMCRMLIEICEADGRWRIEIGTCPEDNLFIDVGDAGLGAKTPERYMPSVYVVVL
jgi:hypothetical protein